MFVRTTGCPLRCTYCDTTHAYFDGKKMTIDDILSEVRSYDPRFVCVTGGEPLSQKNTWDLLDELCTQGYNVSLETSGHVSIENVHPEVKVILDVKTPDSGEGSSFLIENLIHLKPNAELKFVICSEKDFEFAEEFCRQHNLFSRFQVLYSPSFGEVSEKWLAKKMLFVKSAARLQLQLHKFIWDPNERGV